MVLGKLTQGKALSYTPKSKQYFNVLIEKTIIWQILIIQVNINYQY